MSAPIGRKKSKLFIALIFAAFIGVAQLTVAILNIDFFYFNPDSVQSNFSALKRGIDQFFNKNSVSPSFQAFSQKVDFDRRVKDTKPALVLVPVWYYQHYGAELGLEPILYSLNNGHSSYSKVLVIRKGDSLKLADLAQKTVAMTTMGPDTEKVFSSMYHNRYGVDLSSSNIIITPKDADALYALALGQVDASLVSKDTLEVIGETNHRVVDMIQELAVSEPIPTPMLCATGGKLTEQDINIIKEMFMNGGTQSPLPAFMKMLRFDGWKSIHN